MLPRHLASGRHEDVGGIAPNAETVSDLERLGKIRDVLWIDAMPEQQPKRDRRLRDGARYFRICQQTAGLVGAAESAVVPHVDEDRLSRLS